MQHPDAIEEQSHDRTSDSSRNGISLSNVSQGLPKPAIVLHDFPNFVVHVSQLDEILG
jgi:hypothetical protein